jgi:hypothetical protein
MYNSGHRHRGNEHQAQHGNGHAGILREAGLTCKHFVAKQWPEIAHTAR